MKLDRIKSKGICAVLVPCLLFSTLTLGGCEDTEAENSDLVLDNETENVEEIKEGDVKVFAPGEHMFAALQCDNFEILQYDGYEIFEIEMYGRSNRSILVIYVNTVEVEAIAHDRVFENGTLSGYRCDIAFNTPGIPTQKEQESQKVYTK